MKTTSIDKGRWTGSSWTETVQKEKAGGFGVFQKLLENREKENKQEKRREVLQNTFFYINLILTQIIIKVCKYFIL
jgi:hypothetical protein